MVTNEEMKDIISTNLQKALVKLDWTQGDLARAYFRGEEIATKHRVMITRWVNGQVIPTPADLANLAEVLGVKVADLMGHKKTKEFL